MKGCKQLRQKQPTETEDVKRQPPTAAVTTLQTRRTYMSRTKRITLAISAGALALGAGLGVTGMASAATTPTPAPSSSSASAEATPGTDAGRGMRHGPGRGGQHGAAQAAGLAAKLGVDEARVTEALQAYRAANKPTTPPAEGTKPDSATRDAALAQSLAASLGIEESKVTAALAELRTEAQTERAAALKTKLDKAVTDGTLTQAEADAVSKAVEKGVIGGGGH
jgi:hypothetical protein